VPVWRSRALSLDRPGPAVCSEPMKFGWMTLSLSPSAADDLACVHQHSSRACSPKRWYSLWWSRARCDLEPPLAQVVRVQRLDASAPMVGAIWMTANPSGPARACRQPPRRTGAGRRRRIRREVCSVSHSSEAHRFGEHALLELLMDTRQVVRGGGRERERHQPNFMAQNITAGPRPGPATGLANARPAPDSPFCQSDAGRGVSEPVDYPVVFAAAFLLIELSWPSSDSLGAQLRSPSPRSPADRAHPRRVRARRQPLAAGGPPQIAQKRALLGVYAASSAADVRSAVGSLPHAEQAQLVVKVYKILAIPTAAERTEALLERCRIPPRRSSGGGASTRSSPPRRASASASSRYRASARGLESPLRVPGDEELSERTGDSSRVVRLPQEPLRARVGARCPADAGAVSGMSGLTSHSG